MAYSLTFSETVSVDGGKVAQSTTIAGTNLVKLSQSFADLETDTPIALSVDVSQVKAVYIVSQNFGCTLETNNASTPVDSLTLAADVPYVWHTGKPDALAFGTDITALYVTNVSGDACQLELLILSDATP